LLRLQLQRFASEKTERATPQRRREARKQGNIPKSPELTSAVALIAVLLALKWFGPHIWETWTGMLQNQLSSLNARDLTENDLQGLAIHGAWLFVQSMAPVVGIALAAGLAVAFAQVGPVFIPRQLLPNWQRINPIAGWKRVWSLRTLAEAVKSALKLGTVGVIAYLATNRLTLQLDALMRTDVTALPLVVGGMVFQLAIQISVALLILAALDYLFQRYEYEKSIRMSREEIKEEFKRQEGDPQIKSRIRQRGRALAMRRMMQEVPKADVVITNPTHLSVALRYNASEMSAPTVVAKGADEVAWRIRKIAEQHNVPCVENRPLAQSLYRTVDVGEVIPVELYQAVAEVLAYVYRMKQQGVSR
jgi:flagellar biosynthetic protein FlhB